MRRLAFGLVAVLLVGCTPSEEAAPAEDVAMETAGLSAADLVGTWNMSAYPEGSDSAVTYTMVATEDPSTWTVQFEGLDPMTAMVTFEGNEVTTVVGPYESRLRPGVMVTTTGVSHLEGDMLMGTFVARYETTEPDSVISGTSHGTRAQ